MHLYTGDDQTALHYLRQVIETGHAAGYMRSLAYALHWQGQVLLAQGDLAAAAASYTQAADLRQAHDQPHLAMQSRAGLARVRLAQGDSEQAASLIDPIVRMLDELRRSRVEDPCMLWLNCAIVLRALHDPRATTILEQAHTILQGQAAKISDNALRASFLQNVPVNRTIQKLWQERHESPGGLTRVGASESPGYLILPIPAGQRLTLAA